ncbi:MAG: RNA methyltransferase [Bacteroidales bacterium]|nr:RNA methyltransferase [Bacteroidales bacterium]
MIKYLTSLQKKKVREEERLYIIEGDKIIREFILSGIRLKLLISKPEFLSSLPAQLKEGIEESIPVSFEELKLVSTLRTPHNALALVSMDNEAPGPSAAGKGLSVALECVQDPGNLGTIIRAAAWFGIRNIYCSPDSVDVYNPKVIQASMGAIIHVKVFYTGLEEVLKNAVSDGAIIYGTMLDGESVYDSALQKPGIILMGNESKGISDRLAEYVTDRIMIPRFSDALYGIDSLNIGMAASVVFSEFARRKKA